MGTSRYTFIGRRGQARILECVYILGGGDNGSFFQVLLSKSCLFLGGEGEKGFSLTGTLGKCQVHLGGRDGGVRV